MGSAVHETALFRTAYYNRIRFHGGEDVGRKVKMAIIALNDTNFFAETESGGVPVLVNFQGEGCPHCETMKRRLAAFDREACGRVKLCAVDVDMQPLLAARFGIHSIPTLLLFCGGSLAERVVGAVETRELWDAVGRCTTGM